MLLPATLVGGGAEDLVCGHLCSLSPILSVAVSLIQRIQGAAEWEACRLCTKQAYHLLAV